MIKITRTMGPKSGWIIETIQTGCFYFADTKDQALTKIGELSELIAFDERVMIVPDREKVRENRSTLAEQIKRLTDQLAKCKK